jgi:hypothetical protein
MAAAAFLMLPVPLYLVAELVTHMMVARYVLATVLGFAVLAALFVFRLTKGSPLVAVTLLGFLLSGAVAEKAAYVRRFTAGRGQPSTLRTMLQGQPPDLAVAVDDPIRCLESAFYEQPDISTRLLYLVDAEGSRRYGGFYYPGKTWLRFKELVPLGAEDLAGFRTRHERYLVYSTGAEVAFLVPKLVADGADVRTVGAVGVERLYLVTERTPYGRMSGGVPADAH